MCQRVDEGREGLFKGDPYAEWRNDFDFADAVELVETRQFVFRVDHTVEVGFYSVSIERCAIVEFDAFTQFEGVDQAILGGGIALGEDILHFEVFVELKQALIEGLCHRRGQSGVGVIGVKRVRLAAQRQHHVFGRQRAASRSHAEHGEQAEGQGFGT